MGIDATRGVLIMNEKLDELMSELDNEIHEYFECAEGVNKNSIDLPSYNLGCYRGMKSAKELIEQLLLDQ